MNQFALQVREYLLKNNLKQKTIVDKLGLSKNAVSQALSRDNISLDKMLLIAEALDCDLKIELIPNTKTKSNKTTQSENQISQHTFDLYTSMPLKEGQKTGYFLDQKENRDNLKRYVKDILCNINK